MLKKEGNFSCEYCNRNNLVLICWKHISILENCFTIAKRSRISLRLPILSYACKCSNYIIQYRSDSYMCFRLNPIEQPPPPSEFLFELSVMNEQVMLCVGTVSGVKTYCVYAWNNTCILFSIFVFNTTINLCDLVMVCWWLTDLAYICTVDECVVWPLF